MSATMACSESIITRANLRGVATRGKDWARRSSVRRARVSNRSNVRAGVTANVQTSKKLERRGDIVQTAASPLDWFKEQASKFVPLKVDEDAGVVGEERFGPPAVVLLGFGASEVKQVEAILLELGGDFVKVKVATEKMMRGTLEQALAVEQEDPAAVTSAANLPHIMFISGLSTGELVQVMDEVQASGMPMPACAAAVPMSINKPMAQLAEEIQGDHQEMLAAMAARDTPSDSSLDSFSSGPDSAMLSLMPAALWLLAAEGEATQGYSQGSYNVTLGLFIFALPGLWSLIKRSTKSKVVQKTFVVPMKGDYERVDALARSISTYFKSKNYKLKEAGETIVFEGAIAASKGQAAALTFYAFIGLLCTALVVSIATDLGDNAYLMVLLSPGVWFYYMSKAERNDEVTVKLMTNDDDTETEVVIRGDTEEVERFWKTLELREKGMVFVEGIL